MKERVSDGLTKFGGELIPEVRCSVLKRAISEFEFVYKLVKVIG